MHQNELSKDKELLFFYPEYKQMVWGGNRMRDVYGYDIPSDNTGEAWVISAHEHGDCVVKGGSYDGRRLSELWTNEPQLFGHFDSDRFPMLVKVLDARYDLSIQVHPDDRYASEHENGSFGKTECWYILDCPENAKIILGHHAKTREELCRMIDEKRWSELIAEVPIKKGDFVQLDPGTVHVIKSNILILETEQNSDITYRMYDYDRIVDGKPRELHLDKCKDVVTVPAKEDMVFSTSETEPVQELVSCDYYTVWKYVVKHDMTIEQIHPFMIFSVVEGEGDVNGVKIKTGDHFMVPYGFGDVQFVGDMVLIASSPTRD